jgi:hypothetical protein
VKYSWHKYNEAMFMLDVWGEMEQFYEDEISKKRFNQMIGDPAEKTNLSVSVDWKVLKNQRKLKMKDLRDEIKKNKDIDSAERNKLLNEHKLAASGAGPDLLKKSTIVGVLPNDVSKGDFNTHSYSGEDSGVVIGPNGKKISYSYDGNNDTSLLYDYK